MRKSLQPSSFTLLVGRDALREGLRGRLVPGLRLGLAPARKPAEPAPKTPRTARPRRAAPAARCPQRGHRLQRQRSGLQCGCGRKNQLHLHARRRDLQQRVDPVGQREEGAAPAVAQRVRQRDRVGAQPQKHRLELCGSLTAPAAAGPGPAGGRSGHAA